MLREILFESDIRVVTLPDEYNFNDIALIDIQSGRFSAPRVLHFWGMRDHLKENGTEHVTVKEI